MRTEVDSLGERQLDDDCLFGINTLRGQENFDISRTTIGDVPAFVHALALVKKAAAVAGKRRAGYQFVLPVDVDGAAFSVDERCDEIE